MIAGVSSGARVDLKVKAGLGSGLGKPGPRKPNLKEPAIAELGVLAGLLLFAMVLLPCAIASLKVESSSDLLEVAKLCRGFL